ncbi:MAG: hypothetical protein RJA49_3108 [Actinomycetota bacterium]|jgi:hypothetical protein
MSGMLRKVVAGRSATPREDARWRDRALPRQDPQCGRHVGKRPQVEDVCAGCGAHAGEDLRGRLKPHAVAPPPHDSCAICGEPYVLTYGPGFSRGYTDVVCDSCSGASTAADQWASDWPEGAA